MNEQSKVAAPILSASSYKEGSRNWTVLNVYRDPLAVEPYTVAIIGETRVPGQLRRDRRRSFRTLAKALNWNMLDFDSPLYEELRDRALEYLEAGEHLDQVMIHSGALTDEAIEQIKAARPGEVFLVAGDGRALPMNRIGFTAPAVQPLQAGIDWLYEGIIPGDFTVPRRQAFMLDFGLEGVALVDALTLEAEPEGDEALAMEPGYKDAIGEWVKAFLASLRFFDLEAFHANRR